MLRSIIPQRQNNGKKRMSGIPKILRELEHQGRLQSWMPKENQQPVTI